MDGRMEAQARIRSPKSSSNVAVFVGGLFFLTSRTHPVRIPSTNKLISLSTLFIKLQAKQYYKKIHLAVLNFVTPKLKWKATQLALIRLWFGVLHIRRTFCYLHHKENWWGLWMTEFIPREFQLGIWETILGLEPVLSLLNYDARWEQQEYFGPRKRATERSTSPC